MKRSEKPPKLVMTKGNTVFPMGEKQWRNTEMANQNYQRERSYSDDRGQGRNAGNDGSRHATHIVTIDADHVVQPNFLADAARGLGRIMSNFPKRIAARAISPKGWISNLKNTSAPKLGWQTMPKRFC
tara:strand:- start:2105 stop:2488 length:384 start_codon:yes stop_codon:yes gene_type:complete